MEHPARSSSPDALLENASLGKIVATALSLGIVHILTGNNSVSTHSSRMKLS